MENPMSSEQLPWEVQEGGVGGLSTPLAQEGRTKFYWETGPFSHADLPQIAHDIEHGMTEEEIRLAVLAINKTSTAAIKAAKKDSPVKKAKKEREKLSMKAARELLAAQGLTPADLVEVMKKRTAGTTPQMELEALQRRAAAREAVEEAEND